MFNLFTKYYLAPWIVLSLVVAVNVVTLFFFIMVLNRIIATDAHDLSTVLTIVTALVTALPLWQLGKSVISEYGIQPRIAPVKFRFYLGANLTFIAITVLLWALLGFFSNYNYQQGLLYYKNNLFADAIADLKKSLYQVPGRSDAAFALGNIYETIAQTDEAKHYYLLSIYSQNSPFKAYNNLARLYIKNGMSEDGPGSIAYEQALDLLTLARNDYVSDENMSKYEQAEQDGVIFKNLAWAHLKLGDILLSLSNINSAEKSFLTSGSLADHPEVKCLRALALANQFDSSTKNNDGTIYAQQCIDAKTRGKFEGLERALAREVVQQYEK